MGPKLLIAKTAAKSFSVLKRDVSQPLATITRQGASNIEKLRGVVKRGSTSQLIALLLTYKQMFRWAARKPSKNIIREPDCRIDLRKNKNAAQGILKAESRPGL
jgi:hypothetical protein